jgi:hypothetical protein
MILMNLFHQLKVPIILVYQSLPIRKKQLHLEEEASMIHWDHPLAESEWVKRTNDFQSCYKNLIVNMIKNLYNLTNYNSWQTILKEKPLLI